MKAFWKAAVASMFCAVVLVATEAEAKTYTIVTTSPPANSTATAERQGMFVVSIVGTALGFKNLEIYSPVGERLAQVTPDSTNGAFTAMVNTGNLTNGTQTFTLMAWDSPAGQPFTHTASKTLPLWIGNITFSSPAQGSTVSGTISVAGTAGAYKNLEISASTGALLARVTPAENGDYNASVNTILLPNGSQTLNIKAWDAAVGQTATHWVSKTRTINVNNGGTTNPSIFITYPANASTISGSAVNVLASVSDNVGVVGVQFKLDGANLQAEDRTAPWGITFDTTVIANGVHTLSVVARNAAGNTSGFSISVTINNPERRGAIVPFTIYKAESATTVQSSVVTGTAWGQMAFEARGKKVANLINSGDYVEFTNVVAASHATIRYSINDGTTGQIVIYVNGVNKGTFNLDSSRLREPQPSPSGVVKFFDDAMIAIPGGIPAGATVKLVREAAANSVIYSLDFLEVEKAPNPIATPTDGTWDVVNGFTEAAIQTAITASQAVGRYKKVFLPPGTYTVTSPSTTNAAFILPAGTTISGAGMPSPCHRLQKQRRRKQLHSQLR